VLQTIILAFSFIFGHPVEIYFSKINPSARNESFNVPPDFLIILMYSKLPEPFNLKTAVTASLAKFSLSDSNNLELRVVLAMLSKSYLNFSSSSK